jgi:hypothetical protein
MEKFIEVFDDIVPIKLINQYENDILNHTFTWDYCRNVTHGNSDLKLKYSPSFAAILNNQSPNNIKSNPYYLHQILYCLAFKLKINILNIIATKLILQIPSINTTPGNIHTDVLVSGETFLHWVCLYYVCDSDGDTILFDDNENEIQRVSPKKGRVVFFDGSILHCSSPPTQTHRAIINIDFKGEKL